MGYKVELKENVSSDSQEQILILFIRKKWNITSTFDSSIKSENIPVKDMFDCTIYIFEKNLEINYRELEHSTWLCLGLQFFFFQANQGEDWP